MKPTSTALFRTFSAPDDQSTAPARWRASAVAVGVLACRTDAVDQRAGTVGWPRAMLEPQPSVANNAKAKCQEDHRSDSLGHG